METCFRHGVWRIWVCENEGTLFKSPQPCDSADCVTCHPDVSSRRGRRAFASYGGAGIGALVVPLPQSWCEVMPLDHVVELRGWLKETLQAWARDLWGVELGFRIAVHPTGDRCEACGAGGYGDDNPGPALRGVCDHCGAPARWRPHFHVTWALKACVAGTRAYHQVSSPWGEDADQRLGKWATLPSSVPSLGLVGPMVSFPARKPGQEWQVAPVGTVVSLPWFIKKEALESLKARWKADVMDVYADRAGLQRGDAVMHYSYKPPTNRDGVLHRLRYDLRTFPAWSAGDFGPKLYVARAYGLLSPGSRHAGRAAWKDAVRGHLEPEEPPECPHCTGPLELFGLYSDYSRDGSDLLPRSLDLEEERRAKRRRQRGGE